MANINYFTLALMWISLFMCSATAFPTSEDDRNFDKELNRELVNWLSSVHYANAVNNPCRFYADNALTAPPMSKRNSELINSLLSLPKNMNDAGK